MLIKIALTAAAILVLCLCIDVITDRLPRFFQFITLACIFVIPISLIIQIWQ